MNSTSKQPNTK